MTMSVNTNLSAINAYNNLNSTSNQMNSTVAELSSGLQIQTAAQDASGYVISQGLNVESLGLGQAIQNGQNGVSVLQIAEGAMNQQVSILQRMNQLATQAANSGAMSTSSYTAVQAEFSQLQSQLDQIASSTSFGTTQLLNGNYTGTFQIGAYSSGTDQVTVTIAGTSTGAMGIAPASVSIGTTATQAQAAMSAVQAAISYVSSAEAQVAAVQNQIQAVISNDTISQQNVQSAYSTLVDANMAQAMTAYSSQQVLMQAGVAMLGQAQQLPSLILKLIP